MNKAAQRALEAYPRDDDKELNFRRANYRIAYERGYEQAEKDTIERAIDWLKDYVKYFEIYNEKGVEEFRKAMEEKK